jgi:soluble lytic murein transglycosylase-like protein
MSKLGITDLMNCYNNVHVGIDFLAELYKANNKNWHKTLMAYNGGQSYANKRCRNGLYSSEYSRKVMSKAENYKAERK